MRGPERVVLPQGLRVAVTRPAPGALAMADAVTQAGGRPLLFPLTRIFPPEDIGPLRRAAAQVAELTWIVFTSANAVRAFAEVCKDMSGPRVAAVGPATAAAVREHFTIVPDLVADVFTAEGVMQALGATPLVDARVLWPRSALADESLADRLTSAGAVVDAPVAYRTERDAAAARALAASVRNGDVDVLTFTAPSGVASYHDVGGEPGTTILAVIGGRTAAAAGARGWRVHVEAETHDVAGMIDGLSRFYRDGTELHA